ncbi:MAG: hypothetical protein FIB00_15410 [Chloroflexi bacterium]|nr:hypothetical protein [Thermoleophilia bacterium]NJD66602.1 hypothetical protein [Chloroflexota bacterium]
MIIAQTAWSDAAIALGGILLVTAIAVALIWQIFKTGRAGIFSAREKAYRELAEEAVALHRTIQEELDRTNQALADVLKRVAEIERVLREVD